MSQPQLGWIGLGSMGIGMATNLHKYLQASSEPPLLYTNRTLSRGEALAALGAKPIDSVKELASKSDIIFSCISNDKVLEDTAGEILSSGSVKGKIYVDCSTVHPSTSAKVAARFAEAGGYFIAAPVFGASPMAAAGKLIFVTAGPESAVQRIAPYLKAMGRSIIPMGEDVQKSSLLKIAGNICVISFMEVISEAHVFAEKTGLGSPVLETMIGDMFGPVLESYSKRLTTGAYAPPAGKAGFDVSLAMKDLRHALSCAKEVGAKLEVGEIALKHMEAAVASPETRGRALDSSSMYGTIRKEAGLDFFTEQCK